MIFEEVQFEIVTKEVYRFVHVYSARPSVGVGITRIGFVVPENAFQLNVLTIMHMSNSFATWRNVQLNLE